MLDAVILGQGLAGSLLAYQLIEAGQRLVVMDNGHRDAASQVAAGLITPVTGLRMVKSPHTEAWLNAGAGLYARVEAALGRVLVHPKPMWRLFADPGQREAWQQRLHDPAYRDYLDPDLPPDSAGPYASPHGHGLVHHAGYLDTKSLLSGMREWLQQREAYREQELDYTAITVTDDHVVVDGIKARWLIFCEGARGVNNPWFGRLSLTPVQGDILTLEHAAVLPDVIANLGKWLLPVDAHHSKFGSTYDWDHSDRVPRSEARDHLLAELAVMLRAPLATTVVKHEVGLRPNTHDRLPLLGPHAQHPPLYLFNGFGSKGSLMIPYYAQHLTQHLQHGSAIADHCHFRRWVPKP